MTPPMRPCRIGRLPLCNLPILVRGLVLALGLVVAPLASAETLRGRVVGIADGDTLTVLDSSNQQHRIRLYGIDAPEKKQPFGTRSKQNLAALAFAKHAVVEWTKLDRYGRIVGKVIVEGQDLGLQQIEAGLAWWYRKYSREQSPQDQATYARAEEAARTARAGLWSDSEAVPPWEYRHPALASQRLAIVCRLPQFLKSVATEPASDTRCAQVGL